MKLKMNLNSKMYFFILATCIIIFVVAIGYISINFKKQSLESAKEMIDIKTLEYSLFSESFMDEFMAGSKMLAKSFESFREIPPQKRRDIFMSMMKDVLRQNEDFLSVWSIWELNALDSLDTLYVNKPGSTYKGNFSPTYYKENGEIKLQKNDATVLFQGEYYTIPKKTRRETVLNPYYYSYTGNEEDAILQTNMITPIIIDEQFFGVVGVDAPLEVFQERIGTINPAKGGYAFLLANNGVFVAHPDSTKINIEFDEVFPELNEEYKILEKVQNGESFSFTMKDPYDQRKKYVSFSPIIIGESGTPWSIAIVVPVNSIMKLANESFSTSVFVGIVGLIILSIIISFISKSIRRPIVRTTKLLKDLSLGDIDQSKKLDFTSNDEIGEMANAVNTLIDGLNTTANFAHQIGDGNLNAEFKLLSEDDVLGNSLMEMRQSLVHAQKEENKRKIEDEKQNWSTRGIAKFNEILRENSDDMDVMADKIVENLINYIDANQCAFFVLNDDNEKDPYYELKSVMAYGRKKPMEKNVKLGEELIGRAAKDQVTLYLDNVPDNYPMITSGKIGEELPKNVLIVPLNLNDQIYGVIELISFNRFEEYQIEFVEKVGESIASTISSVKVNTKTAELLKQSQEQADELTQHEEEMRQNMEEMQATQEEAAKREFEMKGILEAINSVSMVAEFDMNGHILDINERLSRVLGVSKEKMIGKTQGAFEDKDTQSHEAFNRFWDALRAGKSQKKIQHIKTPFKEMWLSEVYMPILDEDGNPVKVLNISFDITENILLKRQIEKLEREVGTGKNE